MAIFFLYVPLGILAGLVIGIVSSIVVRRRRAAGFLVAQGWSLLIVCGAAGLLAGVPYLLLEKPPTIDGKHLELQFELRPQQHSKFQTSPMATVSALAFTLTINKAGLHSSTGTRSKKTLNTL
jgi:hypothetical protein